MVDGLDRLRDGAPRLACKAGAEQRIHDRRGGGPRQPRCLARRGALPLAVVADAPLGAAQLQRGLTGVRSPHLTVRRIRINGDVALAEVKSSAAGQPASQDTIRLVRQGDDWRVSTLSGPQPPAPSAPGD